jgi:hypothetical protein
MKRFYILFFLPILLISSCIREDEIQEVDEIEISVEDDINLFVWRGLNAFYLWQEDVPVLADTFFSSEEEVYRHFRQFNSPEESFNSLLFEQGETDRFSIIVDDYIALENAFQGISTANGMEFQLVGYSNDANNIFGVVEYVIPNTNAFTNGVERGMVFNTVNGVQLTRGNFRELLFGANSTDYTIGLADYNDRNPISNNTNIALSKTQITENPVLVEKVISEGTKTIGYLMYNQFSSSFDSELNTTFGNFKAQNVNELIVDLRYNGGGSVQTAIYLGSMITGQFNGDVYSKQRWNQKVLNSRSEESFINFFADEIISTNETINSLNLSKVYFIVSDDTASASELVINALSAYIDVTIVGDTTVGKQVGSITLYDSDNLQRSGENLNTEHRYAMQPLVLEIVNKDDENDIDGYTPVTDLPGILLREDFGNLGVLGEKSDPLLEATINLITTSRKSTQKKKSSINYPKSIYHSKLAGPLNNNMYINFEMLEN